MYLETSDFCPDKIEVYLDRFFFIGAVIGLEINRKDSISLCNVILDAMFEGKNKSEFVFASASKNTANKSTDEFFSIILSI